MPFHQGFLHHLQGRYPLPLCEKHFRLHLVSSAKRQRQIRFGINWPSRQRYVSILHNLSRRLTRLVNLPRRQFAARSPTQRQQSFRCVAVQTPVLIGQILG